MSWNLLGRVVFVGLFLLAIAGICQVSTEQNDGSGPSMMLCVLFPRGRLTIYSSATCDLTPMGCRGVTAANKSSPDQPLLSFVRDPPLSSTFVVRSLIDNGWGDDNLITATAIAYHESNLVADAMRCARTPVDDAFGVFGIKYHRYPAIRRVYALKDLLAPSLVFGAFTSLYNYERDNRADHDGWFPWRDAFTSSNWSSDVARATRAINDGIPLGTPRSGDPALPLQLPFAGLAGLAGFERIDVVHPYEGGCTSDVQGQLSEQFDSMCVSQTRGRLRYWKDGADLFYPGANVQVVAAMSGTVVGMSGAAGYSNIHCFRPFAICSWPSFSEHKNPSGGHGLMVLVYSGGGVMTRYANLASITRQIKVGHRVIAGAPIGTLGATGNAARSYLHFSIYVHVASQTAAAPIDPYWALFNREVPVDMTGLPDPTGTGVLKACDQSCTSIALRFGYCDMAGIAPSDCGLNQRFDYLGRPYLAPWDNSTGSLFHATLVSQVSVRVSMFLRLFLLTGATVALLTFFVRRRLL